MEQAPTLLATLPPVSLEIDATVTETGEVLSLLNEAGDVESVAASVRNSSEDENFCGQNLNHRSRLFRLCHLLGVDFLYFNLTELRGKRVPESTKVALVKDFRSACLASLLHILPLSTCMVLTVLNLNGYYIGLELSGPVGEDSTKILGLQFAAKLLELLSMASLSSILFSLIRRQLLGDKLPFGAVTSGFEFNRISLLWSREFIATCSTKFGTGGAKYFLIATLVTFTLLGASIGPSAAVASQPVLRDWPAGGTSFYVNAPTEQLFPLNLDEVSPTELTCAEGQENNRTCFPSNYKLIASAILEYWPPSISGVEANHFPPTVPEHTLIAGRKSGQWLSNRFRGPFVYNPAITVATTPMSFVADSVVILAKYWHIANTAHCARGMNPSFCYYKDAINSIKTVQPLTYVSCSRNSIGSSLKFTRLDQISGFPVVELEDTSYSSRERFDAVTRNSSRTGLEWISLPPLRFGQSSLGAVVAIAESNTVTDPGYFLACTIDARWVNSTTTATFLGGPLFATGSFSDFDASHRFANDSKGQLLWPRINITTQWAEHLNPKTDNEESSAFDFLTKSVARVGNIARVPSPLNAVEGILALMLTEGISRVGNSAIIQGSLKGIESNDWWRHILPGKNVFGSAGSAFDFVPVPGDNTTKFTMETTVSGFGYGPTTATVLSVAVLIVYSIIALAYVVYSTCFTQITSSAWESISELVALGVNSTPAAALRNSGAGISSRGTLKQPVWIGARNGVLELTFEEPHNSKFEGNFESIKPNISYG